MIDAKDINQPCKKFAFVYYSPSIKVIVVTEYITLHACTLYKTGSNYIKVVVETLIKFYQMDCEMYVLCRFTFLF